MNPKHIDKLWNCYRTYCENRPAGKTLAELESSVPGFLVWLSTTKVDLGFDK